MFVTTTAIDPVPEVLRPGDRPVQIADANPTREKSRSPLTEVRGSYGGTAPTGYVTGSSDPWGWNRKVYGSVEIRRQKAILS